MSALPETHPDWAQAVEGDRVDPSAGHRHFVVDSLDKLQWALRKAGRVQAEIEEVEGVTRREIQALEAGLALETAGLRRDLEFFTGLAREWSEAQQDLPADRTTVTQKLPSGEVTKRRMDPKVIVEKPEETIAWCEANGRKDAIERVPTLKWGVLKASVKVTSSAVLDPETGEKVPGLKVEEQPVKITVAPAAR